MLRERRLRACAMSECYLRLYEYSTVEVPDSMLYSYVVSVWLLRGDGTVVLQVQL